MKREEQDALEGLAGRSLTVDEIAALAPLVAVRNDVDTAALLSIGRTKHDPTQIGIGTVVAVLGDPVGGEFLDALDALGETDRTVYWGMDPVRRGVLDLSVPAARASLTALKEKMPAYAEHIALLLQVGVVPDPIPFDRVSAAINKAQGLMTL